MKFICISILVICIVYTTAKDGLFIEDYCWRDFQGIIPNDALVGGLDRNGQPIYIGQVIYQQKLIPGKIYEHDKKIYFEWAFQEIASTQNVKILCTQNPQNFKWIPTTASQVVSLTNTILLRGGYEPNYDTYVGRAVTDGETSVGKVMCSTDSCLGLYTTNNGKTREHKVFEILSYQPVLLDVRLNPE